MFPFTVLVNSSDGFEDCWEPFFTLLARHWPECPAPVVLNTETRDWSCRHIPVRCTRVQTISGLSRRLTWSECLAGALRTVETPLVLYLQEDYFLQARVDSAAIEDFIRMMLEDPEIRHVGLTHFGACGPFEPTPDPRLGAVPRKARYRISTQGGLWRLEALRSYLEPEENGWMFEIYGTQRSRRRNDRFLTVNPEWFGPGRRVLDYLHTGIIRGRWNPEIVAVFRNAGIEVEYARRGFYRAPPWPLRKLETAARVLARPDLALRALVGHQASY